MAPLVLQSQPPYPDPLQSPLLRTQASCCQIRRRGWGVGVTLASRGSRPASGKAPGQHGGFVVAVKQERGEGQRAGEKGSHEEEVRVPALLRRWALALKLRPELNLNLLWLRPQPRFPFPN